MKKQLIIAMVAAFAMASCNKQAPEVEEKSQQITTPVDIRIAYVEVDSIMNQYKFCVEHTAILEKKGQNIQNTIYKKGQELQTAANNFQQNLQNNKYTQQEAENIQARLQKQSADLNALQQRLSEDFQAETEKFNNALRDSIQHYIAVYNKDKKYSLILTKQGDNILYADKSYDITDEMVAGLNKAYKGTPETDKKSDKK